MQFETLEPKNEFSDLVLPSLVRTQIDEIIEDHEYESALHDNGLPVRKKILIHGPPGCGKTSIAHAFAKHMKIRLCAVSTAQIIGSHLGQSEKNMEEAIKFCQHNRVVMLLDEFDSVASNRSSDSDGASSTVNRVVNTILTSLESRLPLGLLLACTNLYSSIDKAVVRRFDTIIQVPEASREALKTIANNIIKGRFGITAEEVLSEASTPSDVVRAAKDKLRRRVIEEEKKQRAGKAEKEKREAEAARAQLSMMLEEPRRKAMRTETAPSNL